MYGVSLSLSPAARNCAFGIFSRTFSKASSATPIPLSPLILPAKRIVGPVKFFSRRKFCISSSDGGVGNSIPLGITE